MHAIKVLSLAAALTLMGRPSIAQVSGVLEEAVPHPGPVVVGARHRFGTTVAIDRNTVVIGVPEGEEIGQAESYNSGEVFVYKRTSGGSWAQVARLVGNGARSEFFGRAVDVDGDTIVVGASDKVDDITGSGAAYVFRRTGHQWLQEALLTAETPEINDNFGAAVAIAGDTVLVGIPGDDDHATNAGGAVVFARSGTTWSQQAKLTGSLSEEFESLGQRVVLAGDVAILHADLYSKAFLFERSGGQWSEELALNEEGVGVGFARAAATDGEWAFFSHRPWPADYRVDVYRREAGGWAFNSSLALQDPGGVWSVECMSVDGFLLAVGIDQRLLGGQVELFVRNGDVWESNTAFGSSDRAPYDRFAYALDVSEGRVLAGAPDHDENCSVFDTDCQSGAAYIFRAQDASSSFCDAADGSLASCPCSSMPGLPDTGCEVGGLTGGVRLDVITAESSPQNHAVLVGAGYPVTSTPASIVLRSSSLEPSALAFGDGLRCVGSSAVRLSAAFAIGGTSTHAFGHEISAGPGSFYYQLWFRSAPAMFCTPAAFSLSNGRVLDW